MSTTRSASKQLRRPRKKLSLEVKLDILRRINAGERKSEVCKALSLAESTVRTIVKYSEKIKERSSRASAAPTAAQSSNYRSPIVVEMERLLSVWIQDNEQDEPISNSLIQEKAKSLYVDLWPNYYTDCDPVPFKASVTWLQRFKLRNTKLHHPALAKFESKTCKNELMQVIEHGGYTWQQIFNVDRTVLYWKRMAPWNCSSRSHKTAVHGLPASNEPLTLLLGGNAAGDFKLKPTVVYHQENPSALRGYSKTRLPVIWKTNPRGRVTRQVFETWFCDYFSPCVERYCSANRLPNKALLVLDDDPSHPTNLEDICPNVKVVFFPRNSSIFEPVHRCVTATFKAYYLRKTLCQASGATDSDDCNLSTGFWKAFNILGAIDNVASAWDEVPAKILSGAWTKMCEDCDNKVLGDVDFPEAEELLDSLKKDIVDAVRTVCGNETTPEDVQSLLDLRHDEAYGEETAGNRRQNDGDDDDEDTEKVLSAEILAKALKGMEEVIGILRENDPNRERSFEAAKKMESAIGCYRAMYGEKQRCKRRCVDAAVANGDQRKGKAVGKEACEADVEAEGEAEDDAAAAACVVNSPVGNLERYEPLSPSCVIILSDIQQT